MYNGKTITAVIPAAGSSRRMQSDVPKVFMELCGVPVLRRTALAFENCELIDNIIVVTRAEDIDFASDMLKGISKLKSVVAGGADRRESVLNGVNSAGSDIIAIHDGARPLVTNEEIVTVIKDAYVHGAATLSAVPKDTVKVADENSFVKSTPDRSMLRNIYTPQVFYRDEYLECANSPEAEKVNYTDDCQLYESLGKKVYLSEGKYTNIKITTPEDIGTAETIIRNREGNMLPFRIGHGYDVHKLVEGRKCIIGGVDIPHSLGLLGHSDADVLLHAISDAILGAAAMGDIGCLFPDNDPAFEGADSLKLLEEVVRVVNEAGYKVGNIDATVIAQKPKLKPYTAEMRENIAKACKVDISAVSVKATTEEKLGFTGKEEGIAAHAVALLFT